MPRRECSLLDDANRVKSAEPIVRDDDGKVIPLSERFRTDRSGGEAWKNRDIRFSPSENADDSWGVDWIGRETGETDSSPAAQNDSPEAGTPPHPPRGARHLPLKGKAPAGRLPALQRRTAGRLPALRRRPAGRLPALRRRTAGRLPAMQRRTGGGPAPVETEKRGAVSGFKGESQIRPRGRPLRGCGCRRAASGPRAATDRPFAAE